MTDSKPQQEASLVLRDKETNEIPIPPTHAVQNPPASAALTLVAGAFVVAMAILGENWLKTNSPQACTLLVPLVAGPFVDFVRLFSPYLIHHST